MIFIIKILCSYTMIYNTNWDINPVRIILKIIIILLFFPSTSFSLDRKTCAKMISGSKTEFGAKAMFKECLKEKGSFFNRSKGFKCAKKTMNENTEFAARAIYMECLR